jgi:hypothetical protein
MSPILKTSTEFNWFICSRPEGDSTLNLDRYTQFFDPKSGLTYNITFDATEKEPCKVLITKDNKYPTGYCGTANQISKECSCGILCESAIFRLSQKVIEPSKRCPYIEYAKSHYKFLKTKFGNKFPDINQIKSSKPGKLSLKLKIFIDNYTNS